MKNLQLVSSAGYYGIENMLMNLTAALQKQGCQNVIGLFHNVHRPNAQLAEIARSQGLPVEAIVCRGQVDRDAVRAIRACIEKYKIDVIHTHGYKADIYGYLAARKLGKPIVATCHSWVAKGVRVRAYTFLDHLALKRFNSVVAVSALVHQSLEKFGVSGSRLETISNGIDVTAFKNAVPARIEALQNSRLRSEDRRVVGVVARLVPDKGVQFLLHAAKEVLAQVPDTIFVVVGDGPMRPELEALTRDLAITENVLFVGQQSDMPSMYSLMDIFVLPSLTEGLPMCILEAQAAGKPVIASAVGGIPTVVRQDHNGILVEPKDAAGLRDAILRLLADRRLREEFGNNGADWVEANFSSTVMALKYTKLYQRVTGRELAREQPDQNMESGGGERMENRRSALVK